ncbi:MAG: hypothetical protein QXP27_04820 [Candidatus Methanomethyliaceae archaeon]
MIKETDFSSLPGCIGYGNPIEPNQCRGCEVRTLCFKIANDSIIFELLRIKAELAKVRRELEVVN